MVIVAKPTTDAEELLEEFEVAGIQPLCGRGWIRRFYGKAYAPPRMMIRIRRKSARQAADSEAE